MLYTILYSEPFCTPPLIIDWFRNSNSSKYCISRVILKSIACFAPCVSSEFFRRISVSDNKLRSCLKIVLKGGRCFVSSKWMWVFGCLRALKQNARIRSEVRSVRRQEWFKKNWKPERAFNSLSILFNFDRSYNNLLNAHFSSVTATDETKAIIFGGSSEMMQKNMGWSSDCKHDDVKPFLAIPVSQSYSDIKKIVIRVSVFLVWALSVS